MKVQTPPGSLSIFSSLRAIRQRSFYREESKKHGPIFKTTQFHHRVICIANLALAHRLLREHASSIAPCPQNFTKDVTGGFLRFMAPINYKIYGPMFRHAFAKPVVEASAPFARKIIRQQLAGITCPQDPQKQLAELTHQIFVRILFGLEPGSPLLENFRSSYAAMANKTMSQRLGTAGLAALDDLRTMLRNPPEAISSISELAQQLDGALNDTVIDNLLFTLRISTNDAAGLLVWIFEFLGRNPQWLDQIRKQQDPTLPSRIIKETLRLSRSEFLYRKAAQEFEFENFLFPEGWLIRICIAECHLDPNHFTDPQTFNPDRFLGPPPSDQIYSPFGIRDHACSGVEFATMIASLVIEELQDYDIVVSGPASAQRGFRHWSHWRPSSKVALRLRS